MTFVSLSICWQEKENNWDKSVDPELTVGSFWINPLSALSDKGRLTWFAFIEEFLENTFLETGSNYWIKMFWWPMAKEWCLGELTLLVFNNKDIPSHTPFSKLRYAMYLRDIIIFSSHLGNQWNPLTINEKGRRRGVISLSNHLNQTDWNYSIGYLSVSPLSVLTLLVPSFHMTGAFHKADQS